MEYTGYKRLFLSNKEMEKLYNGTYTNDNFVENEYLIVVDEEGNCNDYFKFQGGQFKRVIYPSIGNDMTGKMKPRNPEQYCALDLLKDNSTSIKLITGKFGSGKSMAMIIAGLQKVQNGEFDKIIFVRNNVQVSDTDSLGALPGDELAKMLPYLMPFADHCGGVEGVTTLMEQGRLEVIPLGFLRGRSIRNSIIYSMESENLTKSHIQLLMGRVDEGSQLWMDGDIKQRDKVAFEKSKGLETMIERLKGEIDFGFVHLVKSERSRVAALADKLD